MPKETPLKNLRNISQRFDIIEPKISANKIVAAMLPQKTRRLRRMFTSGDTCRLYFPWLIFKIVNRLDPIRIANRPVPARKSHNRVVKILRRMGLYPSWSYHNMSVYIDLAKDKITKIISRLTITMAHLNRGPNCRLICVSGESPGRLPFSLLSVDI